MVTDYYNNVYRKKLSYSGENLGERAVNKGKQEFKRYLDTTPTRQEVFILNPPEYEEEDCFKQYFVSIQQSHQTNVGDRYEKLILGSLDDNWEVGKVIKWIDERWIILIEEKLVIPTHFKGRIRLCNRNLKWRDDEGQVHSVPAHILTSGSLALDEGQKGGVLFEEGGITLSATIPKTSYTRTISRYDRFIIKNQAWRVVGIDKVSVDNLLFLRLEEDQINSAVDRIDYDNPNNSIANYYRIDEDDGVVVDSHTYSINGPNSIIWNQTVSYEALIDGQTAEIEVSFSMAETNLAILTTAAQINPAIVKANTEGLVGTFTLTCSFEGLLTPIEKDIKVVSLWG